MDIQIMLDFLKHFPLNVTSMDLLVLAQITQILVNNNYLMSNTVTVGIFQIKTILGFVWLKYLG